MYTLPYHFTKAVIFCLFVTNLGCSSAEFGDGSRSVKGRKAKEDNKQETANSDIALEKNKKKTKANVTEPNAGDAGDEDLEPEFDIDTINTVNDVRAACASSRVKTVTKELTFPLTAECSFGTDDNLSKKNGYIRARHYGWR